jgi:TIR domain-containing protein
MTAAVNRDVLFVSHAAPEDNEFALWLSSKLASAGYKVWIDKNRLLGGDDSWDAIDHVLRNQAVKQIVVFTRHITKPGVKKELAIGDAVKSKLNDPQFQIAVRNDELNYSDAPPEFLRSNILYGYWRRPHSSRCVAHSDLVKQVIEAYQKDHGVPPAEVFIHARQRFSRDEWDGFRSAIPSNTKRVVGVRIRKTEDLRLFRPNVDVPVLRGTAVILS